MKKFTFILGAVALIAMTSCKKDYTCECTMPGIDGETITISEELKDQKKKDAEDKCESAEITSEITCKLK